MLPANQGGQGQLAETEGKNQEDALADPSLVRLAEKQQLPVTGRRRGSSLTDQASSFPFKRPRYGRLWMSSMNWTASLAGQVKERLLVCC